MELTDHRKAYLKSQNRKFKQLYVAYMNDEINIQEQSTRRLNRYIADVSLEQTKYCYFYLMIIRLLEQRQFKQCDQYHFKHAKTVPNFTHDSYRKTLSERERIKIKHILRYYSYEQTHKRLMQYQYHGIPQKRKLQDNWFVNKWTKYWGFLEQCCLYLKNMFKKEEEISQEQLYAFNRSRKFE